MISLFVRSYHKDFEWLSYSVKSMTKNLKGIDEKILCVPLRTHVPDDISSFFDNIIYTQERHVGYSAQQVDKIRAYQYCKHENIFFSDSDCIYYTPFDARSFLSNDRVKLYKTKYSTLAVTPGVVARTLEWQQITHAATGILPEYEYMRCIPIMHKALTCKILDSLPAYQNYIGKLRNNHLSEFNALGIVAETNLPNFYEFIDTDITPLVREVTQYWSVGGMTPEIRKELETL